MKADKLRKSTFETNSFQPALTEQAVPAPSSEGSVHLKIEQACGHAQAVPDEVGQTTPVDFYQLTKCLSYLNAAVADYAMLTISAVTICAFMYLCM